MNFLKDVYPYSFEGIKDDIYLYRFISSVDGNDIIKIVSLSSPRGDDWYNLGFGNLEEDENGDPCVNDQSENNNKDFDKVLASVFSCLVHFLKERPGAKIFFFGNAVHKHTMYKRKIAANINELQELFIVQGGYADFDVDILDVVKDVVRKGKLSKRVVKIKDANTLIIKNINEIEPFNPQKSKEYDFMLIALNAVLGIDI